MWCEIESNHAGSDSDYYNKHWLHLKRNCNHRRVHLESCPTVVLPIVQMNILHCPYNCKHLPRRLSFFLVRHLVGLASSKVHGIFSLVHLHSDPVEPWLFHESFERVRSALSNHLFADPWSTCALLDRPNHLSTLDLHSKYSFVCSAITIQFWIVSVHN